MKLPAVAIAAAFICGIVLGLCPPFVSRVTSPHFLAAGFVAACVLILSGITLTRLDRLALGAAASVVSWGLLGVLGAGIAQQPLPPEHIVRLVDEGRIDLRTPLRWHGKLRDEPARLAWGYSYEIELASVQYQGDVVPTQGGMRLSFMPKPGEEAAPDLHAGDEMEVLTRARRPQVFRDEGAFDRRAYLATQNIDLLAPTSAPRLTAVTLLARVRRRLRDETDILFGAKPQVAGVLRAMLLMGSRAV
jgi:hypothetical protein